MSEWYIVVISVNPQNDHQEAPSRKESHLKKFWVIEKRGCKENIVFGEDILMDHVVEFLEQVVVNREHERRLGMSFLKEWAHENWASKQTYEPVVPTTTPPLV